MNPPDNLEDGQAVNFAIEQESRRLRDMIRVEGLTKTYRPELNPVYALRGITAVINPAEFVAVMGPSGSGKSTFMNRLGCLDTPTSGSYWLDGQEVSQLTGDELAAVRNQKIGFVFKF